MVVASQLIGRISIQGDDTAKSKLSSVSKAVDATQASLTNKLASAAKSAGSGFLEFGQKLGLSVIGFKGIAEGAMGLASALLAPNASMEQTRVSFGAFIEDSKLLESTLAGLKSFAATTPFETPEINKAALALLNMDVQAKDLTKWLGNVGAAVAKIGGSGQQFEDITQIIAQMGVEGKVTTGEMMQLQERGIPAFKILAKAMGVPVSQLKDMISNSELGADKIELLVESLGKFGGDAMLKQGQTFNGLLSTLKDNAAQALASFAGPAFEMAKSGLTQLGNLVSSKAFQDFAATMGEKVGVALQNIGQFIQTNVVPAFNAFMAVLRSPQAKDFATALQGLGSELVTVIVPAFNNAKPAVNDLFNFIQTTALPALTGLTNGLKDTIRFLRENSTAATVTAAVITGLFIPAMIKSGVEAVIAGVKHSTQFVASIIKTGVEGWTAAGKLALFTGSLIKSGVEAVIAGTKVAAQFVASMVKAGVQAVTSAALVTGSFVASIIATGARAVASAALVTGSFIASLIATGAQAVVTGAIMFASLVPALLATAASALLAAAPFILIGLLIAAVVAGIIIAIMNWGTIMNWLQGVWTAFSGWFMGFLTGLGNFFVGIWNGLKSFFQAAWNFIVNAAKIAALVLFVVITGPIGLLVLFIISRWSQISAFLIGAWNNLRSMAGNFVGGVVSAIQQLPGRAMAFISDLATRAKNTFTGLANDAVNLGRNIVQGIINGISAMIENVKKAAGRVAQAIRDFLPHSPAKLGPLMDLDETMPALGDMLSRGLNDQIGKISKASFNVAAAINPVAAFSPGALPSGAQAIPSSFASASSATASKGPVTIVLEMNGRQFARAFLPDLSDSMREGLGIRAV